MVYRTQYEDKHTQNKKNLTQISKKMSNKDPTGELRMRTLGSRRDKQFLLLITHPLCYSYIQPSPVKVFALIEERKKSTSKVILDSLSVPWR